MYSINENYGFEFLQRWPSLYIITATVDEVKKSSLTKFNFVAKW